MEKKALLALFYVLAIVNLMNPNAAEALPRLSIGENHIATTSYEVHIDRNSNLTIDVGDDLVGIFQVLSIRQFDGTFEQTWYLDPGGDELTGVYKVSVTGGTAYPAFTAAGSLSLAYESDDYFKMYYDATADFDANLYPGGDPTTSEAWDRATNGEPWLEVLPADYIDGAVSINFNMAQRQEHMNLTTNNTGYRIATQTHPYTSISYKLRRKDTIVNSGTGAWHYLGADPISLSVSRFRVGIYRIYWWRLFRDWFYSGKKPPAGMPFTFVGRQHIIPPYMSSIYESLLSLLQNKGQGRFETESLGQLRALFAKAATGEYFSVKMKKGVLDMLSKPQAFDLQGLGGVMTESLNAMGLDASAPSLTAVKVAAGPSSAAHLNEMFWLNFRNVTEPGNVELTLQHGGPGLPEGYTATWPVVHWGMEFRGKLAKDGYVDINMNFNKMHFAGPAAKLRLFEWDGKYYKDITTHVDIGRGIITGRTGQLAAYVIASPAGMTKKDPLAKPTGRE